MERATTEIVTETGAGGDSAGDVLTFAKEFFDATTATGVGSDNGYCIRTVAGAAFGMRLDHPA